MRARSRTFSPLIPSSRGHTSPRSSGCTRLAISSSHTATSSRRKGAFRLGRA